MMGACRLNNKSMRNLRKDTVYQCLVVDLYLIGALEKEEAELLIGSGIPKGLCLPGGVKTIEEQAPAAEPTKPAATVTEDEDEE